jgi:coenzyme F420-reducing hydrogenase alpha subunit
VWHDQEQTTRVNVLENAKSLTSHSVAKSLNLVNEEIDRLSRRNFSLYLEEAKINGYGFQAYQMERKVVPHLEELIKKIEQSLKAARMQMPKWTDEKWNWTKEAKYAELGEQFNFFYGYTSRLLHAKPMSFGTGQEKLEANEIAMFLDFIYVSILEIIEISERLAGLKDPSAH